MKDAIGRQTGAEIPPANIRQHAKRAHFQVYIIMKGSIEKDLPEPVAINFGWENDEKSNSVLPVTVPKGFAGCIQIDQTCAVLQLAMRKC